MCKWLLAALVKKSSGVVGAAGIVPSARSGDSFSLVVFVCAQPTASPTAVALRPVTATTSAVPFVWGVTADDGVALPPLGVRNTRYEPFAAPDAIVAKPLAALAEKLLAPVGAA